jgi:hypothetical protein
MPKSVPVVHEGRRLEILAVVAAGDWQIWVCEGGHKVFLHSVLPCEHASNGTGNDVLLAIFEKARREITDNVIAVPRLHLPRL